MLTVHYLDILSDVAVALVFFDADHAWWFYLCIAFVAMMPVTLALFRFGLAISLSLRHKPVTWKAWVFAIVTFFHGDSAFAAYSVLRSSLKAEWNNDPMDERPSHNSAKDGLLLPMQVG